MRVNRWASVCVITLALAVAGCTASPGPGPGAARSRPANGRTPARLVETNSSPVGAASSHAASSLSPFPWAQSPPASAPGHLRAGSAPGALPGDLLIADKLNNRLIIVDPQGRIRWRFPQLGDLTPGQTFLLPDDAFFTPDGRDIIATEARDSVIRVINVATRKIVYQYGRPGEHGDGPNQLWNPDDAVVLLNGNILTADTKNERILLIGHGQHTPLREWGHSGHGYHHPPDHYGAPNGVFPIQDGHFLVTETRGDWVDSIDLSGRVFWSAHPSGVASPSDSNEISPGRYLTVDSSSPGQILIFDKNGNAIWRYKPSGAQAMNDPSLALPLPNGDIVCSDDANHRVIVVDPRTNAIVWQYGHTGAPGMTPGYLDNPDGLDLAPPYSLIDHTIG